MSRPTQLVATGSIMNEEFRALVLTGPGTWHMRTLSADSLPQNALQVQVLYSSVNYKDALAVTGVKGIVRARFPFVPGIDLVGSVRSSRIDRYRPGDQIILTGGGLGESAWGGYSQIQSIDPRYVIPLPRSMTPRVSMILGTAGLTAMLSIMALERLGINNGDIVVTGASGGVGMIAVFMLSRLGYSVTASFASQHLSHKLLALGATAVIDRLMPDPERPLQKGRWDGAVDAAGGAALAAVLPQIKRHGCVAASGNAAGASLATTVFPFILRGVTLAGIDSNTATLEDRTEAWNRLADLVSGDDAERLLMSTITLSEVPGVCRAKVDGKAPGRFVVDVNDLD